jgi:hypothetical protein
MFNHHEGKGNFFHIFWEGILDFRGSRFPFELESNSKVIEKLMLFQPLTVTEKIWHQKCSLVSRELKNLPSIADLTIRIGKKGVFERVLPAFGREQV